MFGNCEWLWCCTLGITIYGLEAHCYAARNDILEQIFGLTNRPKVEIKSPTEGGSKEDEEEEEEEERHQEQEHRHQEQMRQQEFPQQQQSLQGQQQQQQQMSAKANDRVRMTLDGHRLAVFERHHTYVASTIRRRFEVRMTISKSNVLFFKGHPDKCNEAKQYVESLFLVEKEVEVAKEMRSLIVGKNGRKVRNMSVEYGVIINVPTKDDDHHSISVLGPHGDNVDKACKALLDCVEKLCTKIEQYQPKHNDQEHQEQCESVW